MTVFWVFGREFNASQDEISCVGGLALEIHTGLVFGYFLVFAHTASTTAKLQIRKQVATWTPAFERAQPKM